MESAQTKETIFSNKKFSTPQQKCIKLLKTFIQKDKTTNIYAFCSM